MTLKNIKKFQLINFKELNEIKKIFKEFKIKI